MRSIHKIITETKRALGKGVGRWPLRLVQTLHLPLGPLYLFAVGDIKRNLMPSAKDLKAATKEFSRQHRLFTDKSKTAYFTMFFPPLLKVQELFMTKGTVYIVTLGELGAGILPDVKDLENVRDMFTVAFTELGLGDKQQAAVFFPPIIMVKRTVNGKREGLSLVLGDRERNIMPSKKDIKNLKDLVVKAVKDLGIKPADVKVVSA